MFLFPTLEGMPADKRGFLAETFAGLIDWHEIAALVARGCPPNLALEIVR